MNHPRQRALPVLVCAATALFAMPKAFAAGPAGAAETAYPGLADAGGAPSRLAVGVVAGTQRRPYRGMDNEARVLPLVYYDNSWVRVVGPMADFKLWNTGTLSFGLRLQYALDGYDASDSPFLNGMDKRKGGFWIGPSARWRTPYVNFSAALLGDASGNSRGAQARLLADKNIPVGSFIFTPRLAATWHDRKYVGYYYGVKASEVLADRPLYEGNSAFNVELGLRSTYRLAPAHAVFLDVSVTTLGKGIKDSPLVDRKNSAGVRMGYLYAF